VRTLDDRDPQVHVVRRELLIHALAQLPDDVALTHRAHHESSCAYQPPLFERMWERIAAAGGAFKVLFLSHAAGDHAWMDSSDALHFDHEVLRSVAVRIRKRAPAIPFDLERNLANSPTPSSAAAWALVRATMIARRWHAADAMVAGLLLGVRARSGAMG
jgi:hypothetical protein